MAHTPEATQLPFDTVKELGKFLVTQASNVPQRQTNRRDNIAHNQLIEKLYDFGTQLIRASKDHFHHFKHIEALAHFLQQYPNLEAFIAQENLHDLESHKASALYVNKIIDIVFDHFIQETVQDYKTKKSIPLCTMSRFPNLGEMYDMAVTWLVKVIRCVFTNFNQDKEALQKEAYLALNRDNKSIKNPHYRLSIFHPDWNSTVNHFKKPTSPQAQTLLNQMNKSITSIAHTTAHLERETLEEQLNNLRTGVKKEIDGVNVFNNKSKTSNQETFEEESNPSPAF